MIHCPWSWGWCLEKRESPAAGIDSVTKTTALMDKWPGPGRWPLPIQRQHSQHFLYTQIPHLSVFFPAGQASLPDNTKAWKENIIWCQGMSTENWHALGHIGTRLYCALNVFQPKAFYLHCLKLLAHSQGNSHSKPVRNLIFLPTST